MPLGSFRYHYYYGIENVENYRELDLKLLCEQVYVRRPAISVGGVCIKSRSCDGSASGIKTKMKIDFWLESKLQTISTIQQENSQMISGNTPVM